MFGERGATAVEAAIVTPVVIALLFGIIEMGFLFKDYLAAAGAVRSGVRIASANPRNATFAQVAADNVARTGAALNFKDVQQLWVYKARTDNDKPFGLSDFADCDVDKCVKFSWNTSTKKFDKIAGYDWASTSQNACSSSSLTGPPDRIGVYIKLRHNAFTGLIFNTIYVSEASILSLEPISALTGCK